MTRPDEPLTGGSLRAAISDELGHLLLHYSGRGPTQTHTVVHDDLIVCLLEHTLTKAERSLINAGHHASVLNARNLLHDTMRDDLTEVVQRHSGRKVIAFMSDHHLDPDISAALFVLQPQTAGDQPH
ncbi:MAG: DUF2294 domain-containing protein [Actinomycetota bacterium]|nr:DUF2294 domain-containing protein [Actinomycetota bacterium]